MEPEEEAREKVVCPAGEMQPLTEETARAEEWSLNRDAMLEPCRLPAFTEANTEGSNPPPADDSTGFCTTREVMYTRSKYTSKIGYIHSFTVTELLQ